MRPSREQAARAAAGEGHAAGRNGDAGAEPPASTGREGGTVGTVSRLFETVLGVAGIDPDRHFLELGGHSLAALRVLSSLERETGAFVPLSEFLEIGTVRGVAARIAREAAPVADGVAGGPA
jgi:acyl carrier protein